MAKKVRKRPPKKVGTVRVDGQEMAVMREPGGTGLTAIIRGNTKDEVWRIVSEMQAFALENDLEQVEIMSIQPSPAGGWEAIVRAHNFNPLSWAKQKVQAGWTATAGARQKAKEVGKKVVAPAETLRRGMTPDQWDQAKADFRQDATVPNKPAQDTRAEDAAVMAWLKGKKRKARQQEEMMKYGIEGTTKGRTAILRIPKYDAQGNITHYEEIKHEQLGKELTTDEIERKLKKAKQEMGKPFAERAAGKVEEAIRGTAKYGTAAAVATGQAAQRPMGTQAFRRGAQTFGPPSGMTPFVAAPSPAAQERLMRSTVMPGISPVSTGMRRLPPGAMGTPSVVGGVRPMPIGTRAPSPVGGLHPMPPGWNRPPSAVGTVQSAPPVGGMTPMPLGFGGGRRRTRVPSVLPGQEWTEVR